MKRNNLALLLIVFCFLSGSIRMHAQSLSKLEYEVSEFCKRLQLVNGALYIDTTDVICGTTSLHAHFKPELAETMESIIKKLDMECREFSFTNIYKDFERVYISPESFASDTIPLPDYTEYEINYGVKYDSVVNAIILRTYQETDSVFSPSELSEIEYLLQTCSNSEIVAGKNDKTKKRILTIKEIFESNGFYLIVYSIYDRHYYYDLELIIK